MTESLTTHGGYSPGHAWYYLLGGEVVPPKMIRAAMRISGYKGYRAEEIRAVAALAEPGRTRKLRQIRQEVLLTLRADLSRYREVVRELHVHKTGNRRTACASLFGSGAYEREPEAQSYLQ